MILARLNLISIWRSRKAQLDQTDRLDLLAPRDPTGRQDLLGPTDRRALQDHVLRLPQQLMSLSTASLPPQHSR